MSPGRTCRAAARVAARETLTGRPSKASSLAVERSQTASAAAISSTLQGIYTRVGLSGGHPRLETRPAGMTRAVSLHRGARPGATRLLRTPRQAPS
jgi:hypothetical protein